MPIVSTNRECNLVRHREVQARTIAYELADLPCLPSSVGSIAAPRGAVSGLALPKLQKIYGSIIASIIIGVIWGLWHAPLYLTGICSGGIEEMLGRFLWTIPLAFLFTWVYKRTQGSLLVSILLHTSVNFQGDISSVVLQVLPN